MEEEMKLSEKIKTVCDFFASIPKDYDWYREKANEMTGLQEDYLHLLELGGYDYGERAKIATKLSKCRKERREYKDRVEQLKPVADLLSSKDFRNVQRSLQSVLGDVRQIERRQGNRLYSFRVLDGEGIMAERNKEKNDSS